MCLYFNPKTQEEQTKQLFGDKQEIVVYKLFCVCRDMNRRLSLVPPYQGGNVKTEKGFYISDRTYKENSESVAYKGIHVFLEDHAVLPNHILVEAIAHKNDLVAIGRYDHEAVFMKIKLPTHIIKKFRTEPPQLACEHLFKLTLLIAALAIFIVLLITLLAYIK